MTSNQRWHEPWSLQELTQALGISKAPVAKKAVAALLDQARRIVRLENELMDLENEIKALRSR